MVTLSQQALDCLKEAGVENDIAMPLILNLMRSTVMNLEKTGSRQKALTGPIERGDLVTVERHISSFTNKEQKNLYSVLAKATLELTVL